jgi:hypothetical protein
MIGVDVMMLSMWLVVVDDEGGDAVVLAKLYLVYKNMLTTLRCDRSCSERFARCFVKSHFSQAFFFLL